VGGGRCLRLSLSVLRDVDRCCSVLVGVGGWPIVCWPVDVLACVGTCCECWRTRRVFVSVGIKLCRAEVWLVVSDRDELMGLGGWWWLGGVGADGYPWKLMGVCGCSS
jgi:hypothetical protein